MNERPRLRVLLVEDDENDIIFLKRALRATCDEIELDIARDGEQAVRYLESRGGNDGPDRIILDLKLPRLSGTDVLARIRSNPDLKHLSVTVLTSSGELSDKARIRDLGVDDYIVKPVSYQGLVEVAANLGAKWGIARGGKGPHA